jgi:hypothetical protein
MPKTIEDVEYNELEMGNEILWIAGFIVLLILVWLN